MLVVANELTGGIGRECGLASAGKSEEERHVVLFHSHISGRVKRELTKFDRLEVVLCDKSGSIAVHRRRQRKEEAKEKKRGGATGAHNKGRKRSLGQKQKLTITEKTPFFISPAYSVPRITISIRLKLISTDVVELILP